MAPESPALRPPPDAAEALARHALRRARSVPTVALLSGPVGLGVRAWRRWAEAGRRPLAQTGATAAEAVAAAWADAAARECDLPARALAYLSGVTGLTAGELRAALAARTAHDFDHFWDGLPLDPARDAAAAACRLLLRPGGGPPDAGRLAAELDGALATRPGPWRRVVAALAGLIPPDDLPALLLAAPAGAADPAAWLGDAARLLAALAADVPALPVAVAAEAEVCDRHLRTAPESHALALLREGLVPVAGLPAEAVARQLRDLGVDAAAAAGPARRLAADGADEGLVRTFAEAALRVAGPSAGPDADDRARSAAERFLYERLASHPRTAGLFELNGTLDFRFGRAAAEIDLLARALRVAVEVDGLYYHLAGADAYRRDRRKDWELQRRGYLVLRFLAEDVVARLEEILDRILEAVEQRQSPPTPEDAPR